MSLAKRILILHCLLKCGDLRVSFHLKELGTSFGVAIATICCRLSSERDTCCNVALFSGIWQTYSKVQIMCLHAQILITTSRKIRTFTHVLSSYANSITLIDKLDNSQFGVAIVHDRPRTESAFTTLTFNKFFSCFAFSKRSINI